MGNWTRDIGWEIPGRSRCGHADPSMNLFGEGATSKSSESWAKIPGEWIPWLGLDRVCSGFDEDTCYGRSQGSPDVLMEGSRADLLCSLRVARIAFNSGEHAWS